MQSNESSRFTDICNEPIDHILSSINYYQDKPLIPLIESVKPICGFFNRIEDYVFAALRNCSNPSDGLTQQESASIYLYTMPFQSESSLNILLNQSLRNENREQLKSWFYFLKLFLTALYKLPSQNERVWRRVKNIDLTSKYKKGTKFV